MNPTLRDSKYKSPTTTKIRSPLRQQVKSPKKNDNPSMIRQLKPRNMKEIPQYSPRSPNRNSDGYTFKNQTNNAARNSERYVKIPDQYPIRTKQYTQKSEEIGWRKPPAQFNTPIDNSIFNQPIIAHQFPSPYIKYKIIPALNDKKCLDLTTVENPQKNLRQNFLQIWKYHGGPNQQFYINKTYNNKYYIINVSNGFTIEVPEFSTKEGVHIHANPKNQTENQWWELRENKDGLFQIVSFCGLVLDMQNQSDSKGTRVLQWSRNNGKNQLWKIVPS